MNKHINQITNVGSFIFFQLIIQINKEHFTIESAMVNQHNYPKIQSRITDLQAADSYDSDTSSPTLNDSHDPPSTFLESADSNSVLTKHYAVNS